MAGPDGGTGEDPKHAVDLGGRSDHAAVDPALDEVGSWISHALRGLRQGSAQ
jgi:hypothetical protein